MATMLRGVSSLTLASTVAAAIIGCAPKPNAANIELRRQVQELEGNVAQLKLAHETDLVRIRDLETKQPTIASLPEDRLNLLFTTHGIKLGRLTGGADIDPNLPGDEGFKVYLTPTDEVKDELKASGTITIEAFDLAAAESRIGKWEFSPTDAKKLWNGEVMLYNYVVVCPWQTKPANEQITVKATFIDELTGRSFSAQTVIAVKLNH